MYYAFSRGLCFEDLGEKQYSRVQPYTDLSQTPFQVQQGCELLGFMIDKIFKILIKTSNAAEYGKSNVQKINASIYEILEIIQLGIRKS